MSVWEQEGILLREPTELYDDAQRETLRTFKKIARETKEVVTFGVHGPMVFDGYKPGDTFVRRENGFVIADRPYAFVVVGTTRTVYENDDWENNPRIQNLIRNLEGRAKIRVDLKTTPLRDMDGKLLEGKEAEEYLFGPHKDKFIIRKFTRKTYIA